MTGLKWTWSFIFSQTLKDRLPRCLATSVSAPESSCGSDSEQLFCLSAKESASSFRVKFTAECLQAARTEAVVAAQRHRISEIDDSLSSDLTRHEKHPHDHLHQHPEQDGVVARPANLDETWSNTDVRRNVEHQEYTDCLWAGHDDSNLSGQNMQLTPSWTRVQDKSSIKAGPLTGVHSIGGHSFPFSDAGHFLTEVDVSELAAAVGEEGQLVVVEVLEVQFLVFVAGACEGDHPAGGTFLQARQKQEALTELPHRAQVGQIQLHVEDVKAVTIKLDLPSSQPCPAEGTIEGFLWFLHIGSPSPPGSGGLLRPSTLGNITLLNQLSRKYLLKSVCGPQRSQEAEGLLPFQL
ncbi:hypothetical protein F7725_013180 [Dissostichus mawsoni]|uniref:Uncharacterized protein n=1 Tax=Dissostichus mawsoni TaxID=36200 RepID=A0A7J5YT53_DISMA|nr:hypothetical protein F7725_013180 [Dissostichus mawsoni]